MGITGRFLNIDNTPIIFGRGYEHENDFTPFLGQIDHIMIFKRILS